MTQPGFVLLFTSFLHELAERRQTPEQSRASKAIDRLNETADRIISNGPTDPLREALDRMAEDR